MKRVVRAHWAVENKLHQILDVNFSEDARKDNAPETLSLIRPVIVNMLSFETTQPDFAKKKLSERLKRKFSNQEVSIVQSILGIQPL